MATLEEIRKKLRDGVEIKLLEGEISILDSSSEYLTKNVKTKKICVRKKRLNKIKCKAQGNKNSINKANMVKKAKYYASDIVFRCEE